MDEQELQKELLKVERERLMPPFHLLPLPSLPVALLFGATTSMHNIMLIMNALQPRLSSNTWTVRLSSFLIYTPLCVCACVFFYGV